MIAPFRTKRGADFRVKIAPYLADHANIDFLGDLVGESIFFHISLRLRQGLVVFNTKIMNDWGKERILRCKFSPKPFVLLLKFSSSGVSIWIDNKKLAAFYNFQKIASIKFYQANGAFLHETLITKEHEYSFWHINNDLGLSLTGLGVNDRMELIAKDFSKSANNNHTTSFYNLHFASAAQSLRLRPIDYGDDQNIFGASFLPPKGYGAVLLPGSIWLGYASDSVKIDIFDGLSCEQVCQITLDRQALLMRLNRLSAAGYIAYDDLSALQALDHSHHGDIWHDLPDNVQKDLRDAARRLKLTHLLPKTTLRADIKTTPHKLSAMPACDDYMVGIHAALRADNEECRLWLQGVFSNKNAAESEKIALYLAPVFCACNRFLLLFDVVSKNLSPFPVRPRNSVDYTSRILPFLLLSGQWGVLKSHFRDLVLRRDGYVSTLCIGWLARFLAHKKLHISYSPDMQFLSTKRIKYHKNEVLSIFCDLIKAYSNDPWARAPCHALMNGLLAVLFAREYVSNDLYTKAVGVALSAYGFSPLFWQKFDGLYITGPSVSEPRAQRLLQAQQRAQPDPKLLAAKEAFSSLYNAHTKQEQSLPQNQHIIEAALERLATLGVAGGELYELMFGVAQAATKHQWRREDRFLRSFFRGATEDATEDITPDIISIISKAWASGSKDPEKTSPDRALLRQLGEEAFVFLSNSHALDKCKKIQAITSLFDLARAMTTPKAMATSRRVLALCLPFLVDKKPCATAITARLNEAELRRGKAPWTYNKSRVETPAQRAGKRLFNTLVMIISCHKNLENHLDALKQTWLQDLENMGIAYIVVVGRRSDNGQKLPPSQNLPKNVIELDVRDDYLGLPQKVLAAFSYVQGHYHDEHILKVDDDCFLDVKEYFFSLSFLGNDYYGRPLRLGRGQLDRTWSFRQSDKSISPCVFDKSPEPSFYADGGTAYLLSRKALDALLNTAKTAMGERLISLSYNEDKLVGDLLALSGIFVSGADYLVHVERYSTGKKAAGKTATPETAVPKWENISLPFMGSGVKVAHLDGYKTLAETYQKSRSKSPPRIKIWSGAVCARFGANSGALDLISHPSTLEQARQADICVVSVVRNEMFFLPFFLAHYRSIGIKTFIIADNGSDDGTLEYLLAQNDVVLFSVDTDYRQAHYGVAWQEAMMTALRAGKWSLIADADELIFWQNTYNPKALPQLLKHDDFAQYDGVRVLMLDMYPKGSMESVTFENGSPFKLSPYIDHIPLLTNSLSLGPFSNAPTWTSALRHRMFENARVDLFVAQKIALLRYQPWMRLSDGLHYVSGVRLSYKNLFFGHFKYNAHFIHKVEEEVRRNQHFNNAEEYRLYQNLLAARKYDLYDPKVSQHWQDNRFLQKALLSGTVPRHPMDQNGLW